MLKDWRKMRRRYLSAFRPMSLLTASTLYIALSLAAIAGEEIIAAGTVFSDCDQCPKMVVVPAGLFSMGDASDAAVPNEGPVHHVTIPSAIAVGIYEITYSQWDVCVAEGGCSHSPADDNWGRGNRAVRNVNWSDAAEYVDWISKKTGKAYRLLTEAEWEYMARAGTTTSYPWGDDFGSGNAVCLSCNVGSVMTIEVGQLAPNLFGLYDTVGSQREWVLDCWNSTYEGAPTNGSAWVMGDCGRRVVRGGAWYDSARFIRSASRAGAVAQERLDIIGFRIARDLQ